MFLSALVCDRQPRARGCFCLKGVLFYPDRERFFRYSKVSAYFYSCWGFALFFV